VLVNLPNRAGDDKVYIAVSFNEPSALNKGKDTFEFETADDMMLSLTPNLNIFAATKFVAYDLQLTVFTRVMNFHLL